MLNLNIKIERGIIDIMDINKTIKKEIGVFETMIASGPVIIQNRDGVEKTLLVKHGDKPINEFCCKKKQDFYFNNLGLKFFKI